MMTKNIAEINSTFASSGENAAIALATKLGLDWVAKKIGLGEWNFNHKPPERLRYFQKVVDKHDGKELVKITDSAGRFEQYVIRWEVIDETVDGKSEVHSIRTEALGRVNITEARTRLGKIIETQKPVGYGVKTNVGNTGSKVSSGGKPAKQKKAA